MKVAQHIHYQSKTAFLGEADHQVCIDINPGRAWPDSMRVALLWLASTGKKTCLFESKESAMAFNRLLLQEDGHSIIDIIGLYAPQLDEKGDKWKILRTVTAGPRPITGEPPDSLCPRCSAGIWRGESKDMRATAFKRNPYPLYCLFCGQRYRYDEVGSLAYTGVIDTTRWSSRITRETATQPSLATTEEAHVGR